MKNLFLVVFFLIVSLCEAISGSIYNKCREDQRNLLIGLKNNLVFDPSASTKLVGWNRTTDDCCHWDGVECDVSGRVISLQLDEEGIYGGLNERSDNLFDLRYLEKLNLALNDFGGIQIPRRLSNFTKLKHLNLSNAGFVGQIPIELSKIRSLISFDLSEYLPSEPLVFDKPNLGMFFRNLAQLEELYLDGVNISTSGSDWCEELSSSLPNLRKLSLRNCHLSGPICSSITKLESLSVLQLDRNDLDSEIPVFLTNFSKLTTLSLCSCVLRGIFPENIFFIPTLREIDFSHNMLLFGTLPEFLQTGSLWSVVLSYTSFSGSIPDSIINLATLSRLELSNCSFGGSIPSSLGNLTELAYLDLSFNNFTGSIPLFRSCKKLTHIDLSDNSLTGVISSANFENLTDLEHISLRNNKISGNIPSSLFVLPSLHTLQLSSNTFNGHVIDSSAPQSSSSPLEVLDLSHNQLNGPIPKFFFDLEPLKVLSLSSNFFNGTVRLDTFRSSNLTRLELSFNDLSLDLTHGDYSSPSPQFLVLKLASCKLHEFPQLSGESMLSFLDLSSNQISGEVPNWIWELESLFHLNLSFNQLTGFKKPYNIPSYMTVLDLRSNHFNGELPLPPLNSIYVDYSYNNFSSSIPHDIGMFIAYASVFSVSTNNLTGEIPTSICNASYLQVLDLSGNAFTGSIPSCLGENMELGVLNLGRNNLSGNIPDTFSINCSLNTLDLNKNSFEGKIPESLTNCPNLEVVNVANNRIKDTFPCMLMRIGLRVLILRSNQFYGDLNCAVASQRHWSNLQIIDISTNSFNGDISLLPFSNWSGMIDANDNQQPSHSPHLRYDFLQLNGFYYQDTVMVTMKGLERELEKILILFTSIDLSNNKFHGKIPDTIGELKSLYNLNLSHNSLTGTIPASFGNLSELGSLDISENNLSGKIPTELTSLTFLSVLNLSYNELSGMIPTGSQFQTFSAESYLGNVELCGFPLEISCNENEANDSGFSTGFGSGSLSLNTKEEIEWKYVFAALGYVVGLGISVLLLMFNDCCRLRFFRLFDPFLLKIVRFLNGKRFA